ncbi:MAG: hypothetical protein H7326_04895 [Bdellovibrionaceae bacterium]|nr:hypothetical protein [Pseudobdellovibrionaceae bacterium]
MISTSTSPDFQNYDSNFMGLTTQLSDLLRQAGIEKAAYRPGLKYFKALPVHQK